MSMPPGVAKRLAVMRPAPEAQITVARVDYEILTASGGVITTLDDKAAAITRAKGLAETFPGLIVVEVQHFTPATRRVWKERPNLQVVRNA